MELVGDVKGKIALIVDDMTDTCGTLVKAANLLKENGATKVLAVITHGIFSGDALAKVADSNIDRLYISNTIEHKKLPKNIKVVSMADIFAQIIKRVHEGKSISEVFANK